MTESYGGRPLASTIPSSCTPVLGALLSGDDAPRHSNITLGGEGGRGGRGGEGVREGEREGGGREGGEVGEGEEC